jgi:glutamate/tyrosine decarboxylase-like PLP-dependent enzyme
LQVHGRQAYEELIDRQLKLAAFFANWVRSSEIFELAAPQVLPIVSFRIKHAGITNEERRAAHEAIVHDVTRDGRRWISTTLVNGQSVVRMMVISYLTAHRHLEDLMIALADAAKKHAGVSLKNQAGKI